MLEHFLQRKNLRREISGGKEIEKKGKSKQIVSEMVVDLKIQNLLSDGEEKKANLKMI